MKSKFVGALVGMGIGDALGAGFEGMSAVLPECVKVTAWSSDFLSYIDDTHLMIGVAESLIETKDFSGKHMARILIQRYDQEP